VNISLTSTSRMSHELSSKGFTLYEDV